MELKTFDILLNEAVEELNEVSLMDLPDFDGTYVLKKNGKEIEQVVKKGSRFYAYNQRQGRLYAVKATDVKTTDLSWDDLVKSLNK